MPSQNPPAKHHYIPAFYLREWETPSDGKLTEFTNPYECRFKNKRVNAENTGFLKYLYTLQEYEPELAQQVELNFFSIIDNDAAISLKMFKRYGHLSPWTSDSRSAWTRFLLSLLLRCPEDIGKLRDWWRSEVFGSPDQTAEAEYVRVRQPDSPKTLAEYMKNHPTVDKERRLFQSVLDLIDHEPLGTAINGMEWRVLKSPSEAPTFLTSDRPVIRTSSLRGARAHIALPIGPRLLFIATPDPDFLISIGNADKIKLVKESNRQVVEGAERFVWACDETQKKFIENRFGKNPQPRTVDDILIPFQENPGS